MTVLENEIDQNKKSLISYYRSAQQARNAQNISDAIKISEQGRIQAELEKDHEWVQKFNAFNSSLQTNKSLNTTIMKEDITLIRGVGPSVAETLREHGFDTIEKLATITGPQLSSVKGIGLSTAQKIVDGARSLSTRKKLNHFTQPKIHSEENPVEEKVKAYTQEDYNAVLSDGNPQKWFSDKFKHPKPGVWYSPSNQKEDPKSEKASFSKMQDDLEQIDDEEEAIYSDEIEIEREGNKSGIEEKELISPQIAFIEEEPLESSQKEVKMPSQGEKLEPSEKQAIEDRIGELLEYSKYNLIRPTPHLRNIFTSADFIALKRINFDNFMDFIMIIPVKINPLRGELKISQQSINYIPSCENLKENSSTFKIMLDSYFEQVQVNYNNILNDLISNGNLHTYLKHHFGIDISIKRSIGHKNLFFTEGNLQLKILIEPVLVCHTNVEFLEKEIPFAYLNDINVHITPENKLTELIEFLEKKILLIETHNKQTHSLFSYNESYEQFLKRSTFLSIPFVGFGIVILLLVFFQLFEVLNFILNIGYAFLGLFFITIPFFYMKVYRPKSEIKAEFLTPYYQKKFEFDETSLILINEKLKPELMIQFGFECLGKHHSSRVIMQVEQENMKKIIDKNRLVSQVKKGGFFEKRIEKEIPSKNKEIIDRYSSFLEE